MFNLQDNSRHATNADRIHKESRVSNINEQLHYSRRNNRRSSKLPNTKNYARPSQIRYYYAQSRISSCCIQTVFLAIFSFLRAILDNVSCVANGLSNLLQQRGYLWFILAISVLQLSTPCAEATTPNSTTTYESINLDNNYPNSTIIEDAPSAWTTGSIIIVIIIAILCALPYICTIVIPLIKKTIIEYVVSIMACLSMFILSSLVIYSIYAWMTPLIPNIVSSVSNVADYTINSIVVHPVFLLICGMCLAFMLVKICRFIKNFPSLISMSTDSSAYSPNVPSPGHNFGAATRDGNNVSQYAASAPPSYIGLQEDANNHVVQISNNSGFGTYCLVPRRSLPTSTSYINTAIPCNSTTDQPQPNLTQINISTSSQPCTNGPQQIINQSKIPEDEIWEVPYIRQAHEEGRINVIPGTSVSEVERYTIDAIDPMPSVRITPVLTDVEFYQQLAADTLSTDQQKMKKCQDRFRQKRKERYNEGIPEEERPNVKTWTQLRQWLNKHSGRERVWNERGEEPLPDEAYGMTRTDLHRLVAKWRDDTWSSYMKDRGIILERCPKCGLTGDPVKHKCFHTESQKIDFVGGVPHRERTNVGTQGARVITRHHKLPDLKELLKIVDNAKRIIEGKGLRYDDEMAKLSQFIQQSQQTTNDTLMINNNTPDMTSDINLHTSTENQARQSPPGTTSAFAAGNAGRLQQPYNQELLEEGEIINPTVINLQTQENYIDLSNDQDQNNQDITMGPLQICRGGNTPQLTIPESMDINTYVASLMAAEIPFSVVPSSRATTRPF